MKVLKPCPFCGESAKASVNENGWFVECDQPCGGFYGYSKFEDVAIDAWNERPIETLLNNQLSNRWILADTKPDHNTLVLATNGRSVTEAKYCYYAGPLLKHGWYQIDGMSLGVDWASHWMPLPCPPEEYDNGIEAAMFYGKNGW